MPSDPLLSPPTIILYKPQLGENIGMSARAMGNCGVSELRLVAPRDGWPSEPARAAARGAEAIIDQARVFDSITQAVADCTRVFATTSRLRGRQLPTLSPQLAARELSHAAADGTRIGVLFGPENCGLDNETLSEADRLIRAELSPACSSLNLAQAVFLIGWEWRKAALGGSPASSLPSSPSPSSPACKAEVHALLERLETMLETSGFFRSPRHRPEILLNLRAMLQRATPSAQELRTLHGIFTALAAPAHDATDADAKNTKG